MEGVGGGGGGGRVEEKKHLRVQFFLLGQVATAAPSQEFLWNVVRWEEEGRKSPA